MEKELDKIRIVDINEKSFVSRATFYRLFDGVKDVLVYQCDRIFEKLAVELEQEHFVSNKDILLFFIERWLEQKNLMKALVENNMLGIIYDTQMKYSVLMKYIFVEESQLSDIELDYLVSILANMIPSAMNIWYKHGQTESAEEILKISSKSISIISDVLNDKSLTCFSAVIDSL